MSASIEDLQAEVLAKRQEVLPTRGMDNKLKQASVDIDGFYGSRFPARVLNGGGRAGEDRRRNRSASQRGEVRRQGRGHRGACAS